MKLKQALVLDFEGTCASFAQKAIKECSKWFQIEPFVLVEIIENPEKEMVIDPYIFNGCEKIFEEMISKSWFYKEIVEIIKYCDKNNIDLFISTNCPVQPVENSLLLNGVADSFCMIFGREDGPKKLHTEKIARIYEYERIILVGNNPSDFEAIADLKIAVSFKEEKKKDYLSQGVEYLIPGRINVGIFSEIIKTC